MKFDGLQLDKQLERLQGSIQVGISCYGKLPHDGNHDGMKNHKPKDHTRIQYHDHELDE